MTPEITSFLFEQSALVVVGGLIIWYLIKTIKQKDDEIKRLNNQFKGVADEYKERAREFTEVYTLIKDKLSK